MDWTHDNADWPHRAASRFIEAGGVRWHLQLFGHGPALLLVHGTGASAHSWRDVAPLLAERYTVIAPDLPGHAFSTMPPARAESPGAGAGMSLPGMAHALGALLRTLALDPVIAVGHSAGAAVLLRMALDRRIAPRSIVGVNAALMPLAGALRALSPLAKLLARAPLVPRLVALRAGDAAAVDRLIAGTGSRLGARGAEFYARLVRDPGHVAAALVMMAHWDLDALQRDLPRLAVPLRLVVGSADRTVPPAQAWQVARRLAGHAVEVVSLPGLGHLAHEEDPAAVADLVLAPPVSVDATLQPGMCPC